MTIRVICLMGLAVLQLSPATVEARDEVGPAVSGEVVASGRGTCPSGSRHVGAGYCRSLDGRHFMPSRNGSCPSGSHHAGAGFCRASEAGVMFVPALKGSCPSGMHHSGAGYCRT